MTDQTPPSPIWSATIGAAFAAFILLVIAVLPAEYGYDPTGAGKALGLTELADPPPLALHTQDNGYRRDGLRFELRPYEWLEYKYQMAEDSGLVYAWSASGPIIFNFHSEPEGAPEEFAKSFNRGEAPAANGIYTAPFNGEHGWYWENRGTEPVTLTLRAAGFFEKAKLYRDGAVMIRTIKEGR